MINAKAEFSEYDVRFKGDTVEIMSQLEFIATRIIQILAERDGVDRDELASEFVTNLKYSVATYEPKYTD